MMYCIDEDERDEEGEKCIIYYIIYMNDMGFET